MCTSFISTPTMSYKWMKSSLISVDKKKIIITVFATVFRLKTRRISKIQKLRTHMRSPGETKVFNTQLFPILKRGKEGLSRIVMGPQIKRRCFFYFFYFNHSSLKTAGDKGSNQWLIMFSTEDPKISHGSTKSLTGWGCSRQVVGLEANTYLGNASSARVWQIVREESILDSR